MSFVPEVIEPWRTRLWKLPLGDLDVDQAIAEIFSTLETAKKRNGNYGLDTCLYDPERRPYLSQLHDQVLVPAGLRYIQEEMSHTLSRDNVKSSMWFIYGEENRGLDLHSHTGSQLCMVLYLAANPGDLVLIDPRNNACRGYPPQITSRHFANLHLTPEPNTLIIFPSYLQHYITADPGKFRVSLACDLFFGDWLNY